MKLQDVRFKCHGCFIWFVPNDTRAKKLMDTQGYISLCLECEKKGKED